MTSEVPRVARRALRIHLCVLALAIGWAPSAWAEDPPDDVVPFAGSDFEDDEDDEDYWDPPVITPTGQPTRVSAAPSTTYIITGEEIRRSGADTLPEVLRRVPGLDVRWIAAADGQIGPRGFAYELADRLLVLIDGRSAFIDFHGGTPYELLPVSLLDIERVEIVMGPGASVYGNKAMLGTIHIITKRAGEYAGLDVQTAVGTSLDASASARYASGKERWRTKVSVGAKRRASFNPEASEDALRSAFGVVGLSYEPGPAKSLQLEAGVSHGRMSIIPTGSRVDPFGATLVHGKVDCKVGLGGPGSPGGELGLLLVWNEGWNNSDVFPAQEGGFDAHYANPHAEVSHSLRYDLGGQPMHLRWGGELRVNLLDSTITTNETATVNVAGFASHEATLGMFKLTAGARIDRQTFTDVVLSPRVSLIFAPGDRHQLRAAFNTGYNNPNQIQLFSDFETAPGARIVGQTDHAPERIVYGELAYSGVLTRSLRIFVNTFTYRMKDTIALNSAEVLQTGLSFYENNSAVDAYGAEMGGEVSISPVLKAYAHYAHIRLQAEEDYPYGATNLGSPQDKVGVGVQYDHASGIFVTTDFQYFGESEVDRVPALPGSSSPFELTQLQAYAMLHGRLGFVPVEGMEAALSVMNALGDTALHFPGGEQPGTRVMVNWSYNH